MRVFLSSVIFLFISIVASSEHAQSDDSEIGYAVLEVNAYTIRHYTETEAEERRPQIKPANPDYGEFDSADQILVSTSGGCGTQVVTFNVVLSSIDLPSTITESYSLDRSCGGQYFWLGEEQFAIFEGGELYTFYEISKTDDGERVLFLFDDELKGLKDDGLVPHSIYFKNYLSPIEAPYYYNAYDTRTPENIRDEPNLKIIYDGKSNLKRVVYTRAIPVAAFFPEE